MYTISSDFTRVAREPAHNNCRGNLPWTVGHPWPRTYNRYMWLKQAGWEDLGKGGGVRIAVLLSVNYIHVTAGVTQYVGISESSRY